LKPMTIDEKEMKVFLNETTVTGRIDLVNTCFRQIAPITDMIVLCLNLVSEKSRDNFLKLWSPAIKEYASKIPVILIGTKFDLRYEEDIVDRLKRMGSKPIDSDEGRELGRQINALRYYECSAVIDSHYYMENIFGEAVKGALYAKKNLKAYK
jgi:Ras-related C3 botulinum toxin substrate 1